MKEIEILVKILESKKSVSKKLSIFKKKGVSAIFDRYYYHPNRKDLLPTKNKSATEMFRLRKKNDKSLITYKKDVFSGGNWLYSDEYETEIKDMDVMADILKLLGFKPLVIVRNSRMIYYHKEYEICLEDVEGLGLFLEIECLNPKSRNPENVRKEIFELIKSTGIKVSGEVQAGKAELLYRKKHF